jgi:hypothetical protein
MCLDFQGYLDIRYGNLQAEDESSEWKALMNKNMGVFLYWILEKNLFKGIYVHTSDIANYLSL